MAAGSVGNPAEMSGLGQALYPSGLHGWWPDGDSSRMGFRPKVPTLVLIEFRRWHDQSFFRPVLRVMDMLGRSCVVCRDGHSQGLHGCCPASRVGWADSGSVSCKRVARLFQKIAWLILPSA